MHLIVKDLGFAYPQPEHQPAQQPAQQAAGPVGRYNPWGSQVAGGNRATRFEKQSAQRLDHGDWVFQGANFRVGAGTRLGVVGENGSGKSTLIRLLSGRLTPSQGLIRIQGSLAVVDQELELTPGQTVGDMVGQALAGVRQLAAQLEAAASAPDISTDQLASLMAQAEHLAVWDADRRVDEALTRLQACRDLNRQLDTLSIGERYRVRLACRLAERSDFLLLDEPTNHLDDSALAYLAQQIRAWRGGVVVVTHDRVLLDDVATAIVDMDPSMEGSPTLYGQPGYLSYRFAKNQAMHRWRQRYREQVKREAQLLYRLDRTYEGLSDEWRPPKGSRKHRRATRARGHVKASERLVERFEATAVDVPRPPLELLFPDLPTLAPGWDPGQPLLDIRNPLVWADAPPTAAGQLSPAADAPGSVEPDASGSRPGQESGQVSPVADAPGPASPHASGSKPKQASGQRTGIGLSTGPGTGPETGTGPGIGAGRRTRLDLPGERVVIPPGGRLLVVGPNGSGKSTLLGVMAGQIALDRGVRLARQGLRMGVVSQENSPLVDRGVDNPLTMTGFDAAANQALALLSRGQLDPDYVYPIAAFGLLAEEDFDRPLAELSAGQRRRFELARTLMTVPHLLVLDEPTNHLSIDLVDELTAALLTTSAAVVVATHDRRMREDFAAWPTLTLG